MTDTSASDVARLLEQLCVQLGFCLEPDDWKRIVEDPPKSIDAFTDAVIIAEGLDPILIDSALRRQVRNLVRAAFAPSRLPPRPRRRRHI